MTDQNYNTQQPTKLYLFTVIMGSIALSTGSVIIFKSLFNYPNILPDSLMFLFFFVLLPLWVFLLTGYIVVEQ